MPLTTETSNSTIPPVPLPEEDSTGYILSVKRVSKDGGDYVVKCPHCGAIIGIQGEDLSEIRGEQYQHKKRSYQGARGMKISGCDGWLEVSLDANFVREL